jgi:CTP synthase
MRILIVDDDPKSVEPLRQEIQRRFAGTESPVIGFKDSEQVIDIFSPHIIVLDLMQGSPLDSDPAGLQTCEHIWQKRFCPLVVYTAVPNQFADDERLRHPFVKLVTKGSGSDLDVIEHIRSYQPHVLALNEVAKEIQGTLNRALREVAGRVFDNTKDDLQIPEALTRAARRVLAAAMDEELSTGGPTLKTWEHYLCPPSGGHLLTGDIIRKREGDKGLPSNYAVVLTPSCDLVTDGKRRPRVDKVLTATCTGVERLLPDLGLNAATERSKCRDRLLAMLREGHGYSCLPIAELPGEFPTMAADFRKLELISLGDIGGEGKKYVRVASVDNPFRELVAWAYMLNAARPGLPERDFDSWVEEILVAVPAPEKKPEQE